MEWRNGVTITFMVLMRLQALTVGQHIHHNLPDNLEIIDPKTLGLSGTDLENFLGNVKLLPIDGDQGGGGSSGPKTQILTVGFDGNEKLNLDDFASLSTQGLADGDKSVAEMAFKKFQDFFKNPNSAQQFEEQTTPAPNTSYSPSTGSSTTTAFNFNHISTEKPKKKRIRVHKRPVFSSTFKSHTDDTEETSVESTEKPSTRNPDYTRTIQELQTKTTEIPRGGKDVNSQPRNNKLPVYQNFSDQQNINNNGEKQNQASSPSQVGFGLNQNYIYSQNEVPSEEMTYFNPPSYVTTNEPQQHYSKPSQQPQKQFHTERPQQQQQPPSVSQQPELKQFHTEQEQQQREPEYFLRTPNQNFVSQQPEPSREQQPPPLQTHFPTQQTNFQPPTEYLQPPSQQQALSLGPSELQGFPSFQNELAPYFPPVNFDTSNNLNSVVQQQPEQQHNFNSVQHFPQASPDPPPPQQQYVQSQPPQIIRTEPTYTEPPQHHVQHITPLKANFNHEQHTTQTQYFPPVHEEVKHNFVSNPHQFDNSREQKSAFQNQNFEHGNQQYRPQQEQLPINPIIHTTTAVPTTFEFPTHNRFRINHNNNPQQQSFNNKPPPTSPRPFISSNGIFQVTPSSGLIPIATVENAMNAFHSQMNRQKHFDKMKQKNHENKSNKPSFENNFNTFNVNSHNQEIRHPIPTNNNFRQQSNGQQPHPPSQQQTNQIQNFQPPPQQHTNQIQNFNPPPQHHTNQIQHFNPPPQHHANQIQNFNSPPQHHTNQIQNFNPPPQQHTNQIQNFNPPPPPPPPPPPQSFQHHFSHSQQSLPPFSSPPHRPDFRQGPPFQNNFPQQSQDTRQVLPLQHDQRNSNFRGQQKPHSPGPFNQNFRQPPPKNLPLGANNNNFREQRVLHRIHINNTNNFRQFPPQQNNNIIKDNNFGFQTSPSTNFRHPQQTNQFNQNQHQNYRPPPQSVLQQTQSHPIPFNLLRPQQSHSQLQSASAEIPNINRPPPPTSSVLRYPLSNTIDKNNFVRSSSSLSSDHHPEAALYAKSMGLHVQSIKPSPLLTSFRL